MTKKVEEKKRELEQSSEKAGSDDVSLDDSFFCRLDDGSVFCQVDRGKPSEKCSTVQQVDESRIGLNKESLIDAQGKDSELVGIRDSALSEEEAGAPLGTFETKQAVKAWLHSSKRRPVQRKTKSRDSGSQDSGEQDEEEVDVEDDEVEAEPSSESELEINKEDNIMIID
ncbi:uncharacterized protein LOC105437904 [Strongylocentrotus purpuratus]|uniref:Uncharacterized protein n=1 Tax=Strongylocentrotus purpuratus TaxID=7668 RepID=A0A7M7HIW4_STRPU|nr:uncharacterized protein LOC105437904 [Strongylocentrotus purpuratus]|eukprot:XP_011663355.1 PREDICTED: uncharacterized protein LOC105437904 [Strongylocentrotus purpuratus]